MKLIGYVTLKHLSYFPPITAGSDVYLRLTELVGKNVVYVDRRKISL